MGHFGNDERAHGRQSRWLLLVIAILTGLVAELHRAAHPAGELCVSSAPAGLRHVRAVRKNGRADLAP
jgi:hypothetical protein